MKYIKRDPLFEKIEKALQKAFQPAAAELADEKKNQNNHSSTEEIIAQSPIV